MGNLQPKSFLDFLTLHFKTWNNNKTLPIRQIWRRNFRNAWKKIENLWFENVQNPWIYKNQNIVNELFELDHIPLRSVPNFQQWKFKLMHQLKMFKKLFLYIFLNFVAHRMKKVLAFLTTRVREIEENYKYKQIKQKNTSLIYCFYHQISLNSSYNTIRKLFNSPCKCMTKSKWTTRNID